MQQPIRALLVDDEPALLQLLEKYLTRLGFEVEAHVRSIEALASFAASPAQFDLVIADLSMPNINGTDLLARIREINPLTRCLLASGHPVDTSILPEPLRPGTAFLQKPFAPKQLADAIAKLLA